MPEAAAIGQRLESRAREQHRLTSDALRRPSATESGELLRASGRPRQAGLSAPAARPAQPEWVQQFVRRGPRTEVHNKNIDNIFYSFRDTHIIVRGTL